MSDSPSPARVATLLAAALMNLGQTTAPIADAVAGYRSALLAAGLPEDVADHGAREYHTLLIGLVSKAML